MRRSYVVFISFDVGVVAEPDKRPGHGLAMRDEEVAGDPIVRMEFEAWMKLLHLLIISNGDEM